MTFFRNRIDSDNKKVRRQASYPQGILIGSPQVRRTLLAFDIWSNEFDELQVEKNPDCPVCGRKEYEYYGKAAGSQAASLCGRDAVQIVPAAVASVDFEEYGRRWEKLGQVKRSRFTVDLEGQGFHIKLFADGRAIIQGTSDEARARSIYSEYVGL